jgi:hypothetical protein
MKTPDGLVQRLKIKHEQQDLEQAKLVEAESVSFLADATV